MKLHHELHVISITLVYAIERKILNDCTNSMKPCKNCETGRTMTEVWEADEIEPNFSTDLCQGHQLVFCH